MTDPPSKLPSSPAARAFFAALELNPSSQTFNTKSDFIKKRISTLGWRNRFSQNDTYPINVGSFHFSVTQIQRGEIEGTYGTGATVWPAAIVLIKYLELQNHLVHDKIVVDLGSGTGITSIAAALLGARRVVCTDGEDNVVRLANDNIRSAKKQMQENNAQSTGQGSDTQLLGCSINVQKYWWGLDKLDDISSQVDVVLVADCVLPKLYPIGPLVDAIDQLLVSQNAFALLSYEHRHYAEYDPRDKFKELAAEKNLSVHVIPMDEQDPVYSVDDIELWRVHRCNPDALTSE
jgi:predicted nicotinamide N-methyase